MLLGHDRVTRATAWVLLSDAAVLSRDLSMFDMQVMAGLLLVYS